MKLADAQKMAREILEILLPLCERIEVAGSVRRKKAEVHDVDIVLIPKPLVDIVGILQSKLEAKLEKRGSRIISLKINEIGLDLNLATKETFTPLLLFRTGSWRHNMKLATKAKRMGVKDVEPYESALMRINLEYCKRRKCEKCPVQKFCKKFIKK